MKITPSIYCADLVDLKTEISNLLKAGIDQIHFDVMDGIFVQNYALSPKQLDDIKRTFPSLKIDVHIMGVDLLDKIKWFKNADYFTFHWNAVKNIDSAKQWIDEIKQHNLKPGIAIDLDNQISDIYELLDDLNHITIMSIKPGFTGQQFEDLTWKKLNEIKQIKERYPLLKFQIDGGVRWSNFKELIDIGVDWIVVGSMLFESDDYTKTVDKIYKVSNN
ncbi:ribulose-phosphate 3-epimerase [Mycoplasma cottewii]|uniref:Ribulose-phosphate 3-epimerase n=1 Tax=Mycoplasma cottewii TaxID=51364 RepID=A0ABY5U0R4_9MOLU|nr:ribulose-phosphate 3-epimerase [Mycoplasma cottewii]UWD35078.1 ribulose-phosphate 3-epimerase [Mycoplasma cottewii]